MGCNRTKRVQLIIFFTKAGKTMKPSKHPWLTGLGIFILVLVGIRVYLPTAIKNYLNKTIHELNGFDGSVGDVDLALLRGGFSAQNTVIYKESLSAKTPLFRAEDISVNIHWLPLFKGNLIGNVSLFQPQLTIVAESTKEVKQEAQNTKQIAKENESTFDKVVNLVPVRIDSFTIHDGSVAFAKTDTKPDINLFMNDIEAKATNLTNSEKLSDTMVAKFDMHAKAMGSGSFNMFMAMNPLAKKLSFDLKAKLLQLPAKTLNSVTKEYGKFDFEKGSIDLVTEIKVRNSYMNGYVKPLLHDIEIHSEKDKKRDHDSPLRRFWEALIGAGEEVVENQTKETVRLAYSS
jgi:hypothetical protein